MLLHYTCATIEYTRAYVINSSKIGSAIFRSNTGFNNLKIRITVSVKTKCTRALVCESQRQRQR